MLYKFTDARNNRDIRRQLADGDFEDMKDAVVKIHEKMSRIDYNTEVGEESGVIGTTHWYFRHRDEKAKERINSVPRKSRKPVDLRITGGRGSVGAPGDAGITDMEKKVRSEEISAKLALLRLKSMERSLERQQLEEPVGAALEPSSPAKTSYASFMSKL